MPRKANATIGTIQCPITGELAAVRKEASGRLYIVSPAGKLTPYTERGQAWMLEHARLWGPDGPPPETPDWIARGRGAPPPPPPPATSKRRTAPAPADTPGPGGGDDDDFLGWGV